jgi:hypothetical protein
LHLITCSYYGDYQLLWVTIIINNHQYSTMLNTH